MKWLEGFSGGVTHEYQSGNPSLFLLQIQLSGQIFTM